MLSKCCPVSFRTCLPRRTQWARTFLVLMLTWKFRVSVLHKLNCLQYACNILAIRSIPASRCSHCFQDLSSNCLSVWPSDSYIWKVNASFECQHLGSSRWSHLNSVWRKRLLHRAPTNVFIVNPTKHSASLGKPANRLLLQLCSSLYALHMPRWYLCCIITLNNIFNHIEYEPVIHSIIILRSSLRFCEDIGFRAALLHLWLLVPCSWLPWPHRLRGLLNLTSLCSSAICNALRPQQSRFNTSGMFVKDDWGLKTVPLVCYML